MMKTLWGYFIKPLRVVVIGVVLVHYVWLLLPNWRREAIDSKDISHPVSGRAASNPKWRYAMANFEGKYLLVLSSDSTLFHFDDTTISAVVGNSGTERNFGPFSPEEDKSFTVVLLDDSTVSYWTPAGDSSLIGDLQD